MKMKSSELIEGLRALTAAPSSLPEEERKKLVEACNDAQQHLETPFEAGVGIVFGVRHSDHGFNMQFRT